MIFRARTTAAASVAFTLLLWMPGCAEDVPTAPRFAPGEGSAAASQPESSSIALDGSASRRIVSPVSAAYYASSPAQGRPPDGELPAGTAVEIIENSGSYSLVAWNSQRVWVANDALKTVSAESRAMHKIPTH